MGFYSCSLLSTHPQNPPFLLHDSENLQLMFRIKSRKAKDREGGNGFDEENVERETVSELKGRRRRVGKLSCIDGKKGR